MFCHKLIYRFVFHWNRSLFLFEWTLLTSEKSISGKLLVLVMQQKQWRIPFLIQLSPWSWFCSSLPAAGPKKAEHLKSILWNSRSVWCSKSCYYQVPKWPDYPILHREDLFSNMLYFIFCPKSKDVLNVLDNLERKKSGLLLKHHHCFSWRIFILIYLIHYFKSII